MLIATHVWSSESTSLVSLLSVTWLYEIPRIAISSYFREWEAQEMSVDGYTCTYACMYKDRELAHKENCTRRRNIRDYTCVSNAIKVHIYLLLCIRDT